ncbi:hypothetical protein FOA52_005124, partial [Chlamydomonas sp. UWO 241]
SGFISLAVRHAGPNSPPQLQEVAAHLLGNLASSSLNRRDVAAAGAIDLLCQLLTACPSCAGPGHSVGVAQEA